MRSVHCVSVCNGVTASERRTRTQFMLIYFSYCVRCAVLLYGPHKLDAWRGVLLLRPQKPHRRVCDVCFVVCGEQAPMPNYHTAHYIHYTSRPAAASTTQRITIRAAHIYIGIATHVAPFIVRARLMWHCVYAMRARSCAVLAHCCCVIFNPTTRIRA